MEDRIRELLPIGSVVLLKDAVKRVMIYGVMQTDSETDEDYDYLGVVYPEGSMGDGSSFFQFRFTLFLGSPLFHMPSCLFSESSF